MASFLNQVGWQEWQERGEELVRNLEVRDVPAFGYHHPGRAGNVTSSRGGKLHEVTKPGGVLRLRAPTISSVGGAIR
jgi:hypothetical protein